MVAPGSMFAFFHGAWLDHAISWFTGKFPAGSFWSVDFNIRAMVALIFVSLCCGLVGSLVIGSRMAFFSDALAHCAFAGVSIGFLIFNFLLSGVRPAQEFWQWVTPIMAAFGLLVGCGIVMVRTRSGLASDTVIGVFFAGSIGLAAMLRKLIRNRALYSLEDFLFGDPTLVSAGELVMLGFLAVVTVSLIWFTANNLLLSGFNSSLALSRRVPIRLVHYLFVMLLALIVNLCVRTVGVLLINALMIVPAATAINLSRNLRQMFWFTLLVALSVSLAGQWISWDLDNLFDPTGRTGKGVGIPGTIILLAVGLFALSLLVGPILRSRAGRREFARAA
jgi:zinc transport system permease protein